ncbi:electron transfer flavoprotein subunit alpha/FixB family protein [Trinickia soli]|uniref:Electron transfer flavoprotein subunit alpha n=1 Tax=Trinickia soli TaxID=380675 RepID=A0A2N7W4F2_9BURK|nr:electron transfer flavoprotein subunit alpha/FixB family protein [Trinickia soli]PMS24272.1 electron transfer flavoprotein subunit alpha [Trinickia soli]CAB3673386.1 Electron transfer flavoprotein subunit alpha [Trinickia soli]
MNTVKRIEPRRPFIIAASGLKRITLGNEYAGGASDEAMLAARQHAHAEAPKPRRIYDTGARVLLVAAHSDRGALDEHARQAVAAAAIVADAKTEVVLLVFGELTDDAASLGADKVIELPSLARPAFAPDRALAALRDCVAAFKPAHILMPDNATGDGDLGRRYAAQARATIAAHVVEIDAAHVGCYANAGRSFATRAWPDVILLGPEAVSAKLPFVGAGERIGASFADAASTVSTNGARYGDRGTTQLGAAQVALEEADFIISAGNGVTDIAAFEALADALGAAIGASRVAVDNGYFTRDKQVGATGKTVNASVYIAFGISGAVQHLQGIKDCRHVIAVNLDGSAPIVKRANLTVIADTQATMAALKNAVGQARQARHISATAVGANVGEGVAA